MPLRLALFLQLMSEHLSKHTSTRMPKHVSTCKGPNIEPRNFLKSCTATAHVKHSIENSVVPNIVPTANEMPITLF